MLPAFDSLAVAGQMRKAAVKEFPAILPDKNAKIDGIEVLPMP